MSTDGLLSYREVQHRLNVSHSTARRIVERGELTPIRIGNSIRFNPDEVEALIKQGTRTKPVKGTWPHKPKMNKRCRRSAPTNNSGGSNGS